MEREEGDWKCCSIFFNYVEQRPRLKLQLAPAKKSSVLITSSISATWLSSHRAFQPGNNEVKNSHVSSFSSACRRGGLAGKRYTRAGAQREAKKFHSRPQNPRSFWPVAGIKSSGQTHSHPQSHDPFDLRQGSRKARGSGEENGPDPIFWACAQYSFGLFSQSDC